MPVTDDYVRLLLDEVVVKEGRQRTKVVTEGLLESIRLHGVLNPIIVTKEKVLVAGECRLEASRLAGRPDIPVRYFEQLSLIEVEVIELEENLKRAELSWLDQVRAVGKLHGLLVTRAEGLGKTWTQTSTSEALGMSKQWIGKVIRVAKDINDPKILAAGGINTAYNLLERRDTRAIDAAVLDIAEIGAGAFAGPVVAMPDPIEAAITGVGTAPTGPPAPVPLMQSYGVDVSLLHVDFLEWAPQYKGRPFDLIHCDFPYGANMFGGPQGGGQGGESTYKDTPEVYWRLLKGFGDNLDRLMAPKAHLMFWFSMEVYTETLKAIRLLMPSLVMQAKPLIWMKSDNSGIVPDTKRTPRHIYETCLIGSREDRLLIKVKSDVKDAPIDRTLHPSTKPEPVLRHFMEMFVDEHTEVFDPTCGSGSSLRAAESLGAKRVLGLERDKDFHEAARHALRKFRALRGAKVA